MSILKLKNYWMREKRLHFWDEIILRRMDLSKRLVRCIVILQYCKWMRTVICAKDMNDLPIVMQV